MTDPQIPSLDLPWLDGQGEGATMVISTRIRLARNLSGHRFRSPHWTGGGEYLALILDEVERALPGIGTLTRLGTLPQLQRLLLHERQLISAELAAPEPPGGREAALLLSEQASAMVNEEDHLRIQALGPGLTLGPTHRAADTLDSLLGARLSFAFHSEFGYLTSCPTNVGTGLRASVLIHLPALVRTGEFLPVMRGMKELGLTSRGWHGEGSAMLGHLVQLSNQTTVGRSEDELLNHLMGLVRQVMQYEARAREAIWVKARTLVEDQIWRAFGTLKYARSMTLEESIEQLSLVRLGVAQGVLPLVPLSVLNRLLVMVQAAHVAEYASCGLDDVTLTTHRAEMIRCVLAERGAGE